MTEALLIILMSWAAGLSGYDKPEALPEVQLHAHDWFVENACPTMDNCNVIAWYNDQGIIHLDESYDSTDGFFTSIIVHELVHYLQPNDMEPCDREFDAYAVQNQYIILNLTTFRRPIKKCAPSSTTGEQHA